MTTSLDRRWIVPVARAIPAAILALAITFSADHSTTVGFVTLAAFAVVTGLVLVTGALRSVVPRVPFLVLGCATLLGGAVAFVVRDADIASLLLLFSAFFAVTGIIELVAGLRARGANPAARDWIFVGGLGAAFALVLLLVPAGFSQVVSTPDKVLPPLTASVIAVGMLGAYAAIVAVYLVIAGLSLKWAPQASTVISEA